MVTSKKIAGKKKAKSGLKKLPFHKIEERHVTYLTPVLIFIIASVYFYWFGSHIFFYQENISLFVFSSQYLHQFAVKPGGMLEYAGNFLAQGFYNSVYGSMILSVILTLLVIIGIRINKRLSSGRTLSLIFILIPACLLLLMQTNFNWLIRNSMGFLFTMLFFLYSTASDNKQYRIFSLVLFPAFYYLTGAFAWIYLCMYLIYSLEYDKGLLRIYYPVFLLIIAFVSFILFKEVLFLQPPDALLLFPFSLRDNFTHPVILFLLIGFFILLPVLIKASSYLKIKSEHSAAISLSSVLAVMIITVFLLSKWHNPDITKLFQLEKYVYEQDWDAVIKHQETYQQGNIVAQFYYNLALSEKDQLCDRLFFGRQDYGTKALIIPWDSKAGVNNIARGVYFFYAVGLINEAHRWAYESMVAQGYRPENLKLLIKTDLINGHYKMAEKYIHILQKTLHYRSWAKKYEAMLYHPERVLSDPELGEKMRMIPREDFSIRIRNPQTNIPLLLQSNPDNKKAFEYIITWFLLEKNIQALVNEVERMKEMSYSRIPRHIEEALLIYNMATGMFPDLGGLKISDETIERFRQYQAYADPYTGFNPSGEKDIQKKNRDTFWFYFEFR